MAKNYRIVKGIKTANRLGSRKGWAFTDISLKTGKFLKRGRYYVYRKKKG